MPVVSAGRETKNPEGIRPMPSGGRCAPGHTRFEELGNVGSQRDEQGGGENADAERRGRHSHAERGNEGRRDGARVGREAMRDWEWKIEDKR